MNNVGYIKSFSKGQVTIPKEVREELGIGDNFWLKLYIKEGKIIAEPVERSKDKSLYTKNLLTIKGDWLDADEIKNNSKQVEKQIQNRSL